MRFDADAIVVGAGPAGAAAASFLADAGARVTLVDRRAFPREKPCGEGILPPGVDVLARLGIAEKLLEHGARMFRGIRYHAPGGRTAIGPFPKDAMGMGVRRVVLDEMLLEAARSRAGVTVEESFTVRDLIRDASGTVCGISDGTREILAPVVIAADGTHSAVRRLAGLDGAPTTRNAVRMHFRPAVPPPEDALVDVYVGGATEAYVTPVAPGEFGVAYLVEGKLGAAEPAIRAALAGRGGIAEHLAGAPAISEPMAATGVGTRARASFADGLILLGDAAGSPDPITGMGIAFALRCASLLPAALAPAFASLDFSSKRLARWEQIRRREVRGGFAVTAGVLWLAARDLRAEAAIRTLHRAPGVFTTLFRLASPRA